MSVDGDVTFKFKVQRKHPKQFFSSGHYYNFHKGSLMGVFCITHLKLKCNVTKENL